MSMGGGGGNTTSTGTTYTTNIPEYAKPYVETMLGATQKQLFEGNTDEGGNFNITGFKPYQPYSRDPSDYIAGFSPLQQQAFSGIGSLTPAQQIGQGSALAGTSALGGLDIAGQANPYGFQQQVGGYMNPYLQGVLAPQLAEANRQYDIGATRQQGAATQAGAFGGSREAIMAAENERGRQAALQGIIGQGYNQAFNQAQQQYNQSMQTRLAGLGMAGQAAGTLGQLGQTQYGQQTGIIGLQGQMGAQQQALEQQKINQSIQDYANAQQYPLMQLGVMSNMLRGLPMQAATTNQYVAAPNSLTQGIGAAGAAASIYNATKAEGGVIKSMAKGGITSVPRYDVGGEVRDQLASMGVEELERQARESSSPTIREMAKELLREKRMAQAPQDVGPVGPMGIDYQAPRMAGGGIIAFAKPEEENNYSLVKDSFMDRINAAATGPGEVGIPEPKATDLGAVPLRRYNDLPEIAAMQAEADKQSALAGRDTAEIAKEMKAQAGPNVAAQEQRAKIMSERANLADEAQRQRHMRLAQFFAKWGSTAGPTLVAGMAALNEKLPDLLEDQKSFRKAKLELDKTVYELDNATRLEEQGYAKEARALKEKAAERAMHLNQYISSNATQLKREEIQGEYNLKREKEQAKVRLAEVGQRAKELASQKDQVLLANAEDAVTKTRLKIQERNAKDENLQKDKDAITMYNTQLSNAEGDISKIPKFVVNKYNEAKENIRLRNLEDAKIIKGAETKLARTYKKVTGEDYPVEDVGTGGGGGAGAGSNLSAQDRQALDWANSNPNDPRAAAIKKRLGV